MKFKIKLLLLLLVVFGTALLSGCARNLTVTFVTDGGTEIQSITFKFGELIELPDDPIKTGYDFKGWYLNAELSDEFLPAKVYEDNITLYAKWEAAEFTITWDTMGGSEIEPSNFRYRTSISFPTAPTKAGHNFAGWYMEETHDNQFQPNSLMPASNFTLYARWTKGQYQVNFNSMGGSSVAAVRGVFEDEFTQPDNPTKYGYHFGGWYLDEEFTTEFTTFRIPDHDITVYAKWIPNDLSVNFVKIEGQVTTVTVKYNETVSRPDDPTLPGNTFAGWKIRTKDGLVDYDFTSPVRDNITIEASWTKIAYTVTFESNGGSTVAPITQDYDTKVTLPIPTQDGYDFVAWFTDEACTNQVPAQYFMPLNGQTLYAKWDAKTYSISFAENLLLTITQKYLTDLTAPDDPVMSGYQFLGWFEDLAHTKAFTFPEKMPKRNITLFAKWEIITYEIDYDLAEGSHSGNPAIYDVETGFTLKQPTRTGYTFIGWTGTDLAEMTLNVTVPVGFVGDRSYTAHWQIKSFTVNISSQDEEMGTVEVLIDGFVNGQKLDYNTSITIKATPKAGYQFAGWYNGGQVSIVAEYTFTLGEGDISLVAHFTPLAHIQYTVEYYKEALNGSFEKTSEIIYGTTGSEVTAEIKTYTGFTFDEEASGNILSGFVAGDGSLVLKLYYQRNEYQVVYKDGTSILKEETKIYGEAITLDIFNQDGYRFNGWSYNEAKYDAGSAFTMPAASVEFVAQKELITYSISYYDGGTKLAHTPSSYNVTESVTLVDYNKEGYTFKGWYLAEDFTGAVQTTIPVNSIGNRTYFAKYEANTYGIIYKFGNVTLEGYPLIASYRYNEPVVLNVYEITGYTFVGWFLEPEFNTPISSIVAGTIGNLDLYGKFIPNNYDLTFYNEVGFPIVTIYDLPYGTPITLEQAFVGRPTDVQLLYNLNQLLVIASQTQNPTDLVAFLSANAMSIASISSEMAIALMGFDGSVESGLALMAATNATLGRLAQALDIKIDILNTFKNLIDGAIANPEIGGAALGLYTYAMQGALVSYSTLLAEYVQTWLVDMGNLEALTNMFTIADLTLQEAVRVRVAFPDYAPVKEGYHFVGWRLGSDTVYLGYQTGYTFEGLEAYVPASSGSSKAVKLVAVYESIPEVIPEFNQGDNSISWDGLDEDTLSELYDSETETIEVEYQIYVKDDEGNISLALTQTETNLTLLTPGTYGVIVIPVVKIYKDGKLVNTITANVITAEVVQIHVKKSETVTEITGSGQYYHHVNENGNEVFYFYSNTELTFNGANFEILSGNEYVTVYPANPSTLILGSSYTTEAREVSFTFRANAGGTIYTGKIYPYISQFNLGSSLVTYKNIIDTLSTSLYYDKTAQPYLVGKAFFVSGNPTVQNGFYFPLLVKTTGGKSIELTDSMLEYKVYRVVGENETPVTISENTSGEWEVYKDDKYFYFNELGATYRVEISVSQLYRPEAIKDILGSKSFTFTINEGVNVFTNAELKEAYADLNVQSINIHNNIKAELDPVQMYEDPDDHIMYPYNYSESRTIDLYNRGFGQHIGNVYTRIIDSNAGIDNLLVNGNYFTIDGSNLPTTNYDPGNITVDDNPVEDDRILQAAGLNTAANYKIRNVQVSIFHYSSDNMNERMNTIDGTVTYKNLTVIGNTKTPSVNYSGNSDQIQQAIDLMNKNSGGYCAFALFYNTKMITDNLVVGSSTIAIKTGSRAQTVVNKVHIYNSWANSLYGHGSESFSITNSILETSGGAAIHMEDLYFSRSMAQSVDIDSETVKINNWVSGEESWFKAYTMEVAAMKLKSQVNDLVAQANYGRILRTITDPSSGLSSRKLNLIMLVLPTGEQADPGEEGMSVPDPSIPGIADCMVVIRHTMTGIYPYERNDFIPGQYVVLFNVELLGGQPAILCGDFIPENIPQGASDLGPNVTTVLTSYLGFPAEIPGWGTGVVLVGLDSPIS